MSATTTFTSGNAGAYYINGDGEITPCCPRCGRPRKHNRQFCGRACAKAKDPVTVTCETCGTKREYRPAIAKRRRFCSQSCASKKIRNCTIEHCRKGGAKAMKLRFQAWWGRMMQSVGLSSMTKAEAFKAGYLVGHKRGARKARAVVDAGVR